MYIDIAGIWTISLMADTGLQTGSIELPGILQANGYGNPITRETPWISTLHDTFWHEQEEYKYAQEDGVNVPFLSQPPRHFMGVATYEREIMVPESDEDWYFHVEAARWKSEVFVDGECKGGDCTVCAPHHVKLGKLTAGVHRLTVVLDNSMIYPYRPDAHGVSDALGMTWNGMVGEMALFTESEETARKEAKRSYAAAHPKTVEARNGRFYIDGKPFYFRATHFGGEYPLTGYPSMDKAWWQKMIQAIKEWGLNGIRFHSYCPPEMAFTVADEENITLLVECGMWNHFEDTPDGQEMWEVLKYETRKILENFGHHPSFVFFSPSNEPGGAWHQPLRRWVSESKEYDESLGYGGRRIYTAQSGWPFEVPAAEVDGMDFIYFHRSGFGPLKGGNIRNRQGWHGKDFSVSLEGVKMPVVCHELGQTCAYPNYDIIDKFTGYLQPSNYRVFKECARANGVLPFADEFVKCSGENQLRIYKEELEANFRTPEIQGFEMLDLHDYLGQGTALVGILDAFWENKGYGDPGAFRNHCSDTVLLTRCSSYVWKNTDSTVIPVEICHYGEDIINACVQWKLTDADNVFLEGELPVERIPGGGNTSLGNIALDFGMFQENKELQLSLQLVTDKVHSQNSWTLYVFAKTEEVVLPNEDFVYTRDWKEAKQNLEAGKKVVFIPYLSELNYDCPALSGGSVFWNAQMGPTWTRTMGVVIQEKHPIFNGFPTGHAGGWQWESILRRSRGFHMKGLEHIKSIVQPIDDWNRNLLQALIFEAKVSNGSLLMAAIDWEGSFEERPDAYSLKQAVLRYAASGEFNPDVEITVEAIEEKFFPLLRMQELTKEVSYEADAEIRNVEAIVTAEPGESARMRGGKFPVTMTIELKKPVAMSGFVYMPEQRDRSHSGFAKEYIMEVRGVDGEWIVAKEGRFLNGCRAQEIYFDKELLGDALRLTVKSAYGCEDKMVFIETHKGWQKVWYPETAVLQIAGIHLICKEESTKSDDYASKRELKSRTKEIEA